MHAWIEERLLGWTDVPPVLEISSRWKQCNRVMAIVGERYAAPIMH